MTTRNDLNNNFAPNDTNSITAANVRDMLDNMYLATEETDAFSPISHTHANSSSGGADGFMTSAHCNIVQKYPVASGYTNADYYKTLVRDGSGNLTFSPVGVWTYPVYINTTLPGDQFTTDIPDTFNICTIPFTLSSTDIIEINYDFIYIDQIGLATGFKIQLLDQNDLTIAELDIYTALFITVDYDTINTATGTITSSPSSNSSIYISQMTNSSIYSTGTMSVISGNLTSIKKIVGWSYISEEDVRFSLGANIRIIHS